jgi:hypothetical protein
VDFQEHFLHHVFGIMDIAEQVHRQALQPRAMELVQPLVSRQASPAARLRQGRIVVRRTCRRHPLGTEGRLCGVVSTAQANLLGGLPPT